MFKSDELSLLNLEYFNVVMCVSDVCELESQNGDHWIVLKRQATVPKSQLRKTRNFQYTFLIYHRHSGAKGFHFHSEMPGALDAVLEIINHDDYRLKRKGRTYFDEVLDQFS